MSTIGPARPAPAAPPRRRGTSAAVAIAATGLCAIIAAGCATIPTSSGPSPAPSSAPAVPLSTASGSAYTSPAIASAADAAAIALSQVYTWQPMTEESRADALRRARDWLGGELLAAVEAGTSESGVRDDGDWARWRAQEAVITADARPIAAGEVLTDGVVEIEALVTQTVLPRIGEPEQTTFRVLARMAETGQGWRMIGYRMIGGAGG
ncbi:hypothetical protein [Lolliginicoccus levis]|uniref:hypothetical protein n=1 Tax=Lolliginicoccus levis TaxID=2919542 RepID=UPI00241C7742|nr:hypothetical protein [Lolliginicoccus levis]